MSSEPTVSIGSGDVVGVVLAAGAGLRFGMPKIGAYEGEWLRRAVDALAGGGCDSVVVAMGARVVDPPAGASALRVPGWRQGLAETVRVAAAAVADARAAAMVLHVVDTPDVGPLVASRVLAVAGRESAALVRAVFDGRPGHPVYIGADHLAGLTATLAGDIGASHYLTAHRDVLRLVECGDLATGADHDTPD